MIKTCYCYTCNKAFHWLGINRHRAMHRDKKEYCEIEYTYGDIYSFDYREKEPPEQSEADVERG